MEKVNWGVTCDDKCFKSDLEPWWAKKMKNDNFVKIVFMGGLEVGSNLSNWASGSIPSLEVVDNL